MSTLFDRHRALLDGALAALGDARLLDAFPGGSERQDLRRDRARGRARRLRGAARAAVRPAGPPRIAPGRGRGLALGAGARHHLSRRRRRDARRRRPRPPAPAWAAATPETRVGVCLEALARLNAMSFEMANAVMHTTGQAFAMAFQAGGPHAQDRGLEAVADRLGRDVAAPPPTAIWAKPQGKAAPIVLEKHWRMRPARRGARHRLPDLPDLEQLPRPLRQPRHRQHGDREAAPGRHPAAGADRRRSSATCSPSKASPRDVVLLAADSPRRRVTTRPRPATRRCRIVDYTGSTAFGAWVREQRRRGAGLHRGGGRQLDRRRRHLRLRRHVRQRRLLARALLRADVHRAAGHLRAPRRHRHRRRATSPSTRSPPASPPRSTRCSPIPARAAGVCGAIANPATLDRIAAARAARPRSCATAPALAEGRSATPLIVAVDAADEAAYGEERFGPIAFVVAVDDADDGIARAAGLAERKGAITAALYDTDEARILRAADAFARGGREPLGQPDRQHLRQPERRLQRLSTSPASTRPATPA